MNILMVLDSYFDYYQMIKNCPSDSNVFYFETNLTKILFLLYRTEINLVIIDSAAFEGSLCKIFSLIYECNRNIMILPYNSFEKTISKDNYISYCNFLNKSVMDRVSPAVLTEYNRFLSYFASDYEIDSESAIKKLFNMLFLKSNQTADLRELSEQVFGKVSEKHTNTIYGYIFRLRKALGDDKKPPEIIVKVKKGIYHLNLPVSENPALF
ncbi:MAG: helix-turn-helix domain-containing protein [Spirochaetaceae bacterium]|nr:helix-turn-helix domain-containing protein [Spirochaetaceae bacterium]